MGEGRVRGRPSTAAVVHCGRLDRRTRPSSRAATVCLPCPRMENPVEYAHNDCPRRRFVRAQRPSGGARPGQASRSRHFRALRTAARPHPLDRRCANSPPGRPLPAPPGGGQLVVITTYQNWRAPSTPAALKRPFALDTYAQAKGYWPYAEEQGEYGEKLNSLTKFVASSKLDDTIWGDFPAATVTRDPAATIQELKEQSGKDIWLWGSLKLMHSLLDAGVVDEIRMLVCPASRGKG